MDRPVIEIEGLYFSYHDELVLENVNLSVAERDFVAVIGPNGGGKTTLVKLMLGLLQPNRGRVRLLGASPRETSTRAGYAPQDSEVNPSAPMTVQEAVMTGLLKGGAFRRFTRKDKAAAREALERMGVWEHRRRLLKELSGGQRQRVLAARALVDDPEILILDEPTASLDVEGQSLMYELLRELNQSITVLVVSHDLMVMSSYVKSVACVSRQVHFHDRPEVTKDMLEMAYHCPVELVAHGVPHRVLDPHGNK
jgi:zinc transport system ATP-binding protein